MNANVVAPASVELRYDPRSEHDGFRRLAIATTDRCQANCAHCLMKSGPTRAEQLTLTEMTSAIDFYANNTPLKLVVFTGGESTLLGDALLEAISHCSELGVMTRLVTNAVWAGDTASAESTVAELRLAGLTEVNFSTDDFHAVWIPLDNVKRAWDASKGQGFETVLVATCSGPRSKITATTVRTLLGENIPIVEGINTEAGNRDLPAPASDGTRYLISHSRISRIGRGARLRDTYFGSYTDFDMTKLYGACCGMMDPTTVNADGTIGVCCGINTENNRILTIGHVRNLTGDGGYEIDDFQGLILRAIRTLGPTYLYHLATESATAVTRMQARSVCEVCERLTTDTRLLNTLIEKRDLIERQIIEHQQIREILAV